MFQIQIDGQDEIELQLQELTSAFAELSGKICEVRFDPSKPEQVRAAIEAMEKAVDGRLSKFPDNPLVQQLALALKQKFKEQIMKRASRIGTSPSFGGIPLKPPHGCPFPLGGSPVTPLVRWNPMRPINRRK